MNETKIFNSKAVGRMVAGAKEKNAMPRSTIKKIFLFIMTSMLDFLKKIIKKYTIQQSSTSVLYIFATYNKENVQYKNR